jgi:3-methyladenine DNA glycosylase AlkD
MSTITVKRLASQIRSRLRAAGNEQAISTGLTFFKPDDAVQLYGVKSTGVRSIEKEAYREVRGQWTVADAIALCELLAQDAHHESKMVGVLLLGRYKRTFPKGLFTRVRGWITAGHYPNWAAVDGLAPTLVTPLIVSYPDLIPRLGRWAAARNLWLRRAAVVTFVPLARRGEQLGPAYALVESLIADEHDLMHKACGWLLREAGKTDMRRLERFLLHHGPDMSRTTVRYAIERFPEPQRKSLLAKTRG